MTPNHEIQCTIPLVQRKIDYKTTDPNNSHIHFYMFCYKMTTLHSLCLNLFDQVRYIRTFATFRKKQDMKAPTAKP